MTERSYGNLGGLIVNVRHTAVPRGPGFLWGVVLFVFFGLLFAGTLSYAHSGPYDWGKLPVQLVWGALFGAIVGLPASAAISLYSPFPPSMRGQIVLDRVENNKLWFYAENGKRHRMSLGKRVVNVHDEITIHIGVLSNVLELKTQTPWDMEKLSSALRNEVRIFRHYGDSEALGFR